MIIVYTSNTGNTQQYAKLLSERLGLPAYDLSTFPEQCSGFEAIYLGWMMAGSVVGFNKAKKKCSVKCVVAVGMSKLDQPEIDAMHEKMGLGSTVPLFQLQGGYDINKLSGPYKLIMNVKGKEIRSRLEAKGQLSETDKAMYEMVTKGGSVVSEEKLDPVAAWFERR